MSERQPDFSQMTTDQFEEWKAKIKNAPSFAGLPIIMPESVYASPPLPSQAQPVPAAQVWGSNEYDFTCPSGAQCRMRKLMPEKLLEMGVLDKITALPGLAEEQVEKAEGQPPKKLTDSLPSKEDLAAIVGVLELLIPMVVVEPRVYPVPVPNAEGVVPDRVSGRIYTDTIELMDRIAIMERAVQGVKKMEPFRTGPGQSV